MCTLLELWVCLEWLELSLSLKNFTHVCTTSSSKFHANFILRTPSLLTWHCWTNECVCKERLIQQTERQEEPGKQKAQESIFNKPTLKQFVCRPKTSVRNLFLFLPKFEAITIRTNPCDFCLKFLSYSNGFGAHSKPPLCLQHKSVNCCVWDFRSNNIFLQILSKCF